MLKLFRLYQVIYIFLLFLSMMNPGVSYADTCTELYSNPPDVADPPPLELYSTCYYQSSAITPGYSVINNYGRLGMGDEGGLDLRGHVFTNYGEYYNLGYNDEAGPFMSETPARLTINRGDSDVSPGSIGRFINNGELYNGHVIEVGPYGILEGEAGNITNKGTIGNAGQVYLISVLRSDSGYVGSIHNMGGELINYDGGQWYSDSIYNDRGSITNHQGAGWVNGLSIANGPDSIINNEGAMTNGGVIESLGIINNSGTFINQSGIYIRNGSMNQTSGIVHNDGNLDIDGGIITHTGGSVVNNGSVHIINGRYELTSGNIENHGDFSDSNFGRLITNGSSSSSISNHGAFDIRSSININSFENHAGAANIGRNLTVQTLLIDGGSLNVRGSVRAGQSIALSAGSVTASLIDLGSFASMNFTGGRLSVSTFNGDLLNEGGILMPGGATLISGNYTQLSDAIYEVEIGGLLQGVHYDWLDVEGTATLGGTLDVSLLDFGSGNFEPTLGDTFDVLTAETISGEFDILALALLDNGLKWDVDYILDDFGIDYVRLSVSQVPVPAAVWLFGAGLISLTGVARRKKGG